MTTLVDRSVSWWRPVALGPRARIWLLTAAIAAAGCAMLLAGLPADAPVEPPVAVPWLVLVLAFALTELAVVHVQLDRDSHSFSLTELVFVVGLFVADPVALVLAQVVGSGLVFAGHRRQPPVKLAFNLALYALAGCLGVACFAALVGGGDPVGPRGWVAALVAILVATVVSDLAVFVAISTSDGRFEPRRLPEMMALSLPFAVGTAAVALVGVRGLWSDPLSLLLLILPALLILGSYRAYCRARRERANMVFLHRVSTLLPRGGDLAPALAELLAASRATFRARAAELVLMGPEGQTTTTRSVDGSDAELVTAAVADANHGQLLRLVDAATVARSSRGADRDVNPVNAYARARGTTT